MNFDLMSNKPTHYLLDYGDGMDDDLMVFYFLPKNVHFI